MIAEKKTLTVRAANDHGADTAAYETTVLTVARMLARYSAQAAKAANDNCRPEAT